MKKLLFTLASVALLSYTMTSCGKDEPTDDNNNTTATGIVGKWNTDEMNLVISDSLTGIQLMDTTMTYAEGEFVQEFTEDGMVITTDIDGSDTTYYTYNDGKLALSDYEDMSESQELDATITATEATMTGTIYTLYPVDPTTFLTVKIEQRINATRIVE